tara:strand:- start:31 stop:198 length:168 start_codon:yes stop_codon:yes gene_type:complete
MARELKDFLSSLGPVWEDVHEFDWLKSECVKPTEKIHINPFELNRFPGLKMMMKR